MRAGGGERQRQRGRQRGREGGREREREREGAKKTESSKSRNCFVSKRTHPRSSNFPRLFPFLYFGCVEYVISDRALTFLAPAEAKQMRTGLGNNVPPCGQSLWLAACLPACLPHTPARLTHCPQQGQARVGLAQSKARDLHTVPTAGGKGGGAVVADGGVGVGGQQCQWNWRRPLPQGRKQETGRSRAARNARDREGRPWPC